MERRTVVVVALLVASACGGGDPQVSPEQTGATISSVTTSPVTTSPVTTSPAAEAPPTTSTIDEPTIDPAVVAAPEGVLTRRADVVRVFDGDSMEIELDGSVVEARMIGINAPEAGECHGDTSRATLLAIIDSASRTVEVAMDGDTDRFGRLLVYLSAEGVDINALMVATGNAIPIHGHARQDGYFELAEVAFFAGAGMWDLDVCGVPGAENGDVEIADVVVNPPGPDDENLNGEFVVLENLTGSPVDVSGWVVRDESTANRFVFAADTSLVDRITVFVGCGADTSDAVHWCSDTPVWSNGGDSVLVLDAAGNVIAYVVVDG